MLEKWNLKKSQAVFHSPPFGIMAKSYSRGHSIPDFTAYVITAPTWANVIGITPEKQILLIRQYRFGTDKVELEIPGGVIDPNESPLVGIQRELEEETGFRSDKWSLIGKVDANPAIQNNKCYTFLAEEITPTGRINFDPEEQIEYEFATFDEVRAHIAEGRITNTFIIAAFYWLDHPRLTKT